MKKELTIPEFKDLTFDDFEKFVGKRDVAVSLKKTYETALVSARNTLNVLLADFSSYHRCNRFQLTRFYDYYVKLAKVEYAWRTCGNNVGRLLLVGFAVSELADDVKELKKTLEKEIEENENNDWEEWGEDE